MNPVWRARLLANVDLALLLLGPLMFAIDAVTTPPGALGTVLLYASIGVFGAGLVLNHRKHRRSSGRR